MTHANSPFAIIPWEVFADDRLGKRHLKVLGALLSFRARNTGLFFATREQISERCGLPVTHISNATTDLETWGWLKKTGSGKRATRYEFCVPENITTVPQEVPYQNSNSTENDAQPYQKSTPTVPPAVHADTHTETLRAKAPKERVRASRFVPPTETEVSDYCRERGKGVDPERWYSHYTSNGWRVGRNPMRDWRAAVRTWERNELSRDNPNENRSPSRNPSAVERVEAAIRRRRARCDAGQDLAFAGAL